MLLKLKTESFIISFLVKILSLFSNFPETELISFFILGSKFVNLEFFWFELYLILLLIEYC